MAEPSVFFVRSNGLPVAGLGSRCRSPATLLPAEDPLDSEVLRSPVERSRCLPLSCLPRPRLFNFLPADWGGSWPVAIRYLLEETENPLVDLFRGLHRDQVTYTRQHVRFDVRNVSPGSVDCQLRLEGRLLISNQ
jgi:hypothetical protein